MNFQIRQVQEPMVREVEGLSQLRIQSTDQRVIESVKCGLRLISLSLDGMTE